MREHSRRGGVLYSMRVCVRRVAPSLCSKIFPRKKTKWAESCRFSRKTFLSKRFHSQTTFCFVVCFFLFFRFQIKKTLCVSFLCVCVWECVCVCLCGYVYTTPEPWDSMADIQCFSLSLYLSLSFWWLKEKQNNMGHYFVNRLRHPPSLIFIITS